MAHRRDGYLGLALAATLATIFATGGMAARRLRADRRLIHYALHDALTDLPNRRRLEDVLDSIFALPPESRRYALHFVDLDRFKYVNDTHGHVFGDRLLQRVAERLQGVAGASSLVSRIGGDEFAIVQALGAEEDAATTLAEAICGGLSEPFGIDGIGIVIGATVGVALASRDALAASDLMKAADLGLHAAKASAKGHFRLYDAAMKRAVEERAGIENGLRTAIANGEIALHYQPVVALESGETVGYEALMRWRRPGGTMTPPSEFIPVAEENGQIVELGAWALRRAAADVALLDARASVAVNCSPIQFQMSDVVAAVESALALSGLPAERLTVEVTETTIMKSDARVVGQLRSLRALGVRVSMDDFGTGFSNLGFLELYPIHTIKIDRSFVRTLDGYGRGRAPVRAIIDLAAGYRMSVIAEGVETEEQRRALIELGCPEAQGYLFSRPLPIDEFWRSRAAASAAA